jgi:glutamate-1-semialdehyde 2,1-aminomutase
MKQDMSLFKKFFWGCLDRGVYIAPSPYETGFLSLAHSEADIDETLTVFEEALAGI